MTCLTLTSGLARGCRDSAGGVKYFFAMNVGDVQSITIADNIVTEITLATGAHIYAYMPAKNSASWTETIQISQENGTKFYEQSVTAVFAKNEAALRDAIHELTDSEMIIIVKDNNEKMWILGDRDDSAMVTAGDSTSGQNWGDRNGWSLTISAQSRVPAMEVQPATSSALATALEAALEAILVPQS